MKAIVKAELRQNDDDPRAWLGALACWLCLLLAAGVYAAVALSPKLLSLCLLRNEYEANQLRLVGLEQQVQRMEQVAAALVNDPDFASALARVDFETQHPGEQRIPVSSKLSFEPRSAAADLQLPEVPLPWYTPLLRLLAHNRYVSNLLLAAAAALALLSFIAQPGLRTAPGFRSRSGLRGLLDALKERYRLPEPERVEVQ
jgi:cell division protein FtsB